MKFEKSMIKFNVMSILGLAAFTGFVLGPQLWYPYSVNTTTSRVFKADIDYVNQKVEFESKQQRVYLEHL